ncbi:MAG: hypothetical protein GXO54_03390 [Chloroflexi bacterium]|nr:hypothetical protein [Chloroflexota bacterium]
MDARKYALLIIGGFLTVGLLGLAAVRLWIVVHHAAPVLDEGLYLYKGWLFAQGRYRPFEPYGPWTNHMPLSFLIPGWLQRIFGPGLDTGRYAAASMTLFAFLLWAYAVYRARGLGWALWFLAVAALSPIWLEAYGLAITQPLVNFMLALIVFVLPHPILRPPSAYALALAGLLSAVLVLTRMNMVLVPAVLGLSLLYRWGWHRARWFWLPFGLIMLVGHGLYAPGIFWQWYRLLPSWVPRPEIFPDLHGLPKVFHKPDYEFSTLYRLWSGGVGRYPAAWAGLLAVTWAALKAQIPEVRIQARVWALLGWGLVLAHAWADIGNFDFYMAFYAPMLATWYPWAIGASSRGSNTWLKLGIWGGAIGTFAGFGLGSPWLHALKEHKYTHRWVQGLLLRWDMSALTPHLNNPHLKLGFIFALGLGLVGAIVGTLIGVLHGRVRIPFGAFFGGLVLALAAGLTLAGPPNLAFCEEDILYQHEQAGAILRAWVPEGARVYWAAYDASLLLYGPDVQLAPQQLNLGYNRYLAGDPEMLRRWGYWSPELDQAWLQQADVALVVRGVLSEDFQEQLQRAGYRLRGWLPSLAPCQPNRGDVSVWLKAAILTSPSRP